MSHEAYYQKLYTDYRMSEHANKPCAGGDGYKDCVDAGDGTCIGCGERLIGEWVHISYANNLARACDGLEKVLELTQQELNNANKVANESEAQFRKAKEWNALMELELKNVRSIVDDQEEDLIAARRELVEVVDRTEAVFRKLDELATHHRRHAIEFESEHDNAIAEVLEEFIALHCLEDFHSSVKLQPGAPTNPSPTETEEKR